MQLAMQVILLYLLVAFCDGLWNNPLLQIYEDVLETPYYINKHLRQDKKINYPPDKVPKPPYYMPQHKKEEYVYKSTPKTPHYIDTQPQKKAYHPNENVLITPYYTNTQPKNVQTSTPIVPIKDAETNPYNLMYRHRPASKESIVAGLDNVKPIDERPCLNAVLSANSSLSSPIQCSRTCRQGDRRICYYNFIVEYYQINGLACKLCTPGATNVFCSDCQCVPADGIERSAQIVNRQMPGPSIEVCEGDHVVIDVTNNMGGSDLSIHWHGLFQNGFQYYDGVPFVTQCPIGSGDTFRYQWGANNPGTHFWHAHSGLQKMDGIFGSIVVRQPPKEDPHCHLYDYDLSQHVVLISDWMHQEAVNRFPGRRFSQVGQLPDSILINGKGQYTDQNTGATTNTTLAVIDVEHGKRYRIRLINAFCTVCPGMITIQDHKMTVIATDGRDIKPTIVDSITSFAGERYDFILHANKSVGSYWIQVRGMGGCALQGVQQLAILRYKGAPNKPSLGSPVYNEGLPQGLVLNALNATCEVPMDDTLCVSNLDSIGTIDKGILQPEADIKFYLPVGFYQYTLQELFKPNQYSRFMVASGRSAINAIIDGISFDFPPSPPLSQFMDIPDDQYCNRTALPEDCTEGVCSCTHRLNIPFKAIVEIVLVDELQATNLSHPFHMHGHAFYVMGMGRANENVSSINWKIVQEMDKRNQVNRCFDWPVRKDTVVIPYNGYVVLRFRADNPGYWLFHCHFIYHQMVGMDVLLKVGEQKDIPPVPKDFPKCGHYSPTIGYNAYPPFAKNIHKSRHRQIQN